MDYRRMILLSCAVVLWATGPQAQQVDEQPPLVLADVTVIDGTGAAPRQGVTLLIDSGSIAQILDGDADLPENAQVLDYAGQYVLPGLIDTHVHIAAFDDPEAELQDLLDQGVTTIRDMGGDARTMAVLARDAQIGAIVSPAIHYSAVFFGPPFLQDPRSRRPAVGLEPGQAPWSRVVEGDTDLPQVIAEAKGTGATGLKLYAALAPQLVERITQEAHRQGLRVWSHATIFPSKPSDAAAAGVDVISHAGGLYPESRSDVPASYTEGIGEWMPKQEFAAVDPSGPPYQALFSLMLRHGTILEPTLAVLRGGPSRAKRPAHNRHLAEAADRIDMAALGEFACEVTRAAHQAGVMIAAGTDSTVRRSRPIWREIQALVDCGLSPMEAIQAATQNAAKAIGIASTHGSVEIGKAGDLVILAGNPVDDIANLNKVSAVIKAGKLYEPQLR